MPYKTETDLTDFSLDKIVCWTGTDGNGKNWNVVDTEGHAQSAQEDAEAICAALNKQAVLIQALREIEALAGRHPTEQDYTLIYSKACAALNYAEVTE